MQNKSANYFAFIKKSIIFASKRIEVANNFIANKGYGCSICRLHINRCGGGFVNCYRNHAILQPPMGFDRKGR
jgi:hypothetical protein